MGVKIALRVQFHVSELEAKGDKQGSIRIVGKGRDLGMVVPEDLIIEPSVG